MTAKDHIKNWIERISKKGMEREDIVFLMVQARHLVEDSPNRTKYKIIEFYCDWIVHTKLDRPTETRLIIFREITKIISANWNPTSPDIVNDISKVIALDSLKIELILLFQENDLPLELFNIHENWKYITGFLTYFLQNKLLIFPNQRKDTGGKFKTVINEILTYKKPADFWIKNISIRGMNGRPFWCIELGGEKDTTKLIGELFIKKDLP
jgi:hypothetical protein